MIESIARSARCCAGVLLTAACVGDYDHSTPVRRVELAGSLDSILRAVPRSVILEEGAEHVLASFGGAAVSAEGALLWADPRESNVKLYSPDGTLRKIIGRRGEGPGEFLTPLYPRFGGDEAIYVADVATSTLSRFSLSGEYLDRISPLPLRVIGGFEVLEGGGFLISGYSAATRDQEVVVQLDDSGKVTRRLLPIRDVVPDEAPPHAAWDHLRAFGVGVGAPYAYVSSALSDSIWRIHLQSGEIVSDRVAAPGKPAMSPPSEDSVGDIQSLLRWARNQFTMASPIVATDLLVLTFMRGAFLDGADVIQLIRSNEGAWWLSTDGAVVVAANDQFVVAIRRSTNRVEALYYPRRGSSRISNGF
jgi:hypothetical protein